MKITKEKFTDITDASLDGNTYEACDFSNLQFDYEILVTVILPTVVCMIVILKIVI